MTQGPSAPMRPTPRSSRRVRGRWVVHTCVAVMAWSAACVHAVAPSPGPARDLVVQLRFVAATDRAAGITSSTNALATDLPPEQSLRLRNGTRGVLRYTRSLPIVWTQAAAVESSTRAATGASAPPLSRQGGAVAQTVSWLEAGHELAVQVRWPGGRHPAVVELDAGRASVDERVGADPPGTSTLQVRTRVAVPLDQWTTVARLGSDAPADPYTVSTRSLRGGAGQTPQALQVRVSLP